MNGITKKMVIGITLATLFFIGSMAKISLMVGSLGTHFSCMALVAPLMGLFFGAFPAFCILGVLFVLRSFISTVGITLGLPTLFATLSWSLYGTCRDKATRVADFVVHVCLPLICILVFSTHVTGLARCYALYWIIPVIGYITRVYSNRMIFAQALASTFVAHAVGSICWLFLVPMTDMQWVALIPMVAVERFIYAVGMTTVYYGLKTMSVIVAHRTSKCSLRS